MLAPVSVVTYLHEQCMDEDLLEVEWSSMSKQATAAASAQDAASIIRFSFINMVEFLAYVIIICETAICATQSTIRRQFLISSRLNIQPSRFDH